MKYIVCVTNFHILIAGTICQDWCPSTYRIVDLRRLSHVDDWKVWFKSQCRGLARLVQCLFDNESHAIVSHPYNLWFSLFIWAGRKASFYDDGVAYYNNSKIPTRMTANIYCILARKISPLLCERAQGFGYADILKSAKIEQYYCLYPDVFLEGKDFFDDKITSINLIPSKNAGFDNHEFIYPNDGVAVFLDSVPEILAHYDSVAIFKYFELKYANSNVQFYYKSHPSKTTSLSILFSKVDWALDIDGSFESFVAERDVLDLYSFYSSASMIARVYSAKTNIYCFSTAGTEMLFAGVAPLMKAIGAEVLCVES